LETCVLSLTSLRVPYIEPPKGMFSSQKCTVAQQDILRDHSHLEHASTDLSDFWCTSGTLLQLDACTVAACAVVRCLSVRLSVTFVHCVEMNKQIRKVFHNRIDMHHSNSSFSYQTLWQYSDGDPLTTGGVIYRWGMKKNRDVDQYLALPGT